MATLQLQFHFLHLLLLLLLPFSHLSTAEKQTYIVQISTSQLPATTPSSDGAEWYESSLRSVSTTAELLYTYTHAIHGFSTRLTPREAQLLQSQPGILSVTQESIYHLHTTRSPAFLGLDLASDLLPQANTVGEVVVGVLDTGAWPESRSYDDAGFGPVPSSWKGKCEVGTNFTVSHCNRKLIGARFFAESRSPRDDDGHGTHTSTTAAGSAVDGASLFGFAAGTARGMATRARVAVYKVCWMGGCFSSDILAAMDVAIQDGGVNILAGWTGKVGPTGLAADPRRVEFNIISGTSMSCPHVAGLAALVKAAHPEWSPAAVRSALMTTAYRIQDVATGNDSTPFDHGAGHVDPVSALNPGLVYDLTAEDYLSFLCALNYTELQINTVARRNYTCDPKKKHSVADFNYPSFAVNVDTTQIDGGVLVVKHTRTVTNVGASGGVYKVSVTPEQIPGVKIVVEPETLSFKEANEKKGYTVTFMASSMAIGTNRFARLEWSDGKHVAGSSIAVSWS
ncbi:Subtilisin-like protease SBT1.7 [Linum grandiflorum]